MAQIVYEKSVLSDIALVRVEVKTILLFVSEKMPFVEESELLDLKLILSELLYNAVIHGNNHDLQKKIDICVEILQDTICGKIKDCGKGFNYEQIPCLSLNEDDITKEHGRGIRIVRSLCEELKFAENGTEVSFSKKVSNYS